MSVRGEETYPVDPRIARVTEEINRRMAEPVRIRDLAAAVGLSASHFGQLFRAHWGTSPLAYLHAKRMERARVLLERTSLSVKEVMALVGGRDPSHFAREFRRYHGKAPREWRAEAGIARRDATAEEAIEAADRQRTRDS